MSTTTKKWAVVLGILALGGLGGCGALFAKGPHVPSAYQGTTPITVVNAWDHQLCFFTIFQDTLNGDNWLGNGGKQQNLAPGARRSFSIKPGVYHVVGAFCDVENGEKALGASGTYGAATVTIQGPSVIALGPKPVEPTPGTEALAFAEIHFVQSNGGGSDEAAPAEASESNASPSESSESKSAEPSEGTKAADPNCKPSGATCDQSYQCCSGACLTHSPNNMCR